MRIDAANARLFREGIAASFAESLASATSRNGLLSLPAAPFTVSAAGPKFIQGVNGWALRMAMLSQGASEGAFYTAAHAQDAGWSIAQGAPLTDLQYVRTANEEGILLPEPEFTAFSVVNSSSIQSTDSGLMRRWSVGSEAAVIAALMHAQFEPAAGRTVAALDAWLGTLQERQGSGAAGDKLAHSMATSIACAQLGLYLGDNARLSAADSRAIAAAIRLDPSVFFDSVRKSDLVVKEVVGQVNLAQKQLDEVARSAEGVVHARGNFGRNAMAARQTLEEMFEERQAVLAVPYKEHEQAKRLGAVWFGPRAVWFAPKGVDMAPLREWNPSQHCLGLTASVQQIVDDFERAMASLGLDTSRGAIADGQWHNVKVSSKRGSNRSGAYVLNLDGPSGLINNKHTGEELAWHYEGPLMTPEQKARLREKAVLAAREADRVRAQGQAEAAQHAFEIHEAARPASPSSGYLRRKGISATGLKEVLGNVLLGYPEFFGENGATAIRRDVNYLVIPMRDAGGSIRALQAISPDGAVKSFMRGGQKKGTMAVLGASSLDDLCNTHAAGTVAFVEGYATGATFFEATGIPTVVCFDAGNLEAVAEIAAARLPSGVTRVVAADNDQFHVERAKGFLAQRLGVNGFSSRGTNVEVLSSLDSSRVVSLGDGVADGEWKQAPGGKYKLELEHETDSTEIRALRLEAVLDDLGGKKLTMNFSNRGLEAGRAALALLSSGRPGVGDGVEPVAMLLVPKFSNLRGDPSDWNDLAVQGGHAAVRAQCRHIPALAQSEPVRGLRRGTAVER